MKYYQLLGIILLFCYISESYSSDIILSNDIDSYLQRVREEEAAELFIQMQYEQCRLSLMAFLKENSDVLKSNIEKVRENDRLTIFQLSADCTSFFDIPKYKRYEYDIGKELGIKRDQSVIRIIGNDVIYESYGEGEMMRDRMTHQYNCGYRGSCYHYSDFAIL